MKTLTSGNAPSLSMPGGRQRRSIASLLLTVLSIAVLLALHVELLTTTINKSLCCFDDSSFAVVSKNLASGDGYLLTLDYGNVDHSGRLFHPALDTGPSAILVGAAAIKVFGAKPWAPGLMLVLFNALVLSFCIAVISRRLGIARASSYICLVALASIAVTTQHHEQWFAFFGEVQSLALVLASFVLIAYGNRSRLNLLGAGLLLGMSFLTKELSALFTLPVALLALAMFLRGPARPWRVRLAESLAPLLLVAAGTLLPIVLFEAYRFHAMGGLDGWLQNWTQHIDFVKSQGMDERGLGLSALVAERLALFSSRFSIGFIALSVLALLGITATLLTARDRRPKELALLVGSAWLIMSCYWLLLSLGWARYAFNVIPLAFACAALPVLSISGRESRHAILPGGVLALLLALLVQPTYLYARETWLPAVHPATPSGLTDAQQQNRLEAYLRGYHGTLYIPWWAHGASMEYRLPGHARMAAITASSDSEGLLLIDTTLPLPEGSDWAAFYPRCTLKVEFGERYRVEHCTAKP